MKRKRKDKPIRFQVGDKVWSVPHGYGVVIDVNPKEPLFRYNASFRDGTVMWYDGRLTEKV